MNIHLGTDHAGFEHKEFLKQWLFDNGYVPIDHGALTVKADDDYPDFIIPAVQSAVDSNELAIVFGGSGQGEAMIANKVPGAKAIVYYGGDQEIIKLGRQHNNANVLSIGARFVNQDELVKVVKLWVETEFSDDTRHIRRLEIIKNYHKGIYPRIGLGVILKKDDKILLGKRINAHDSDVWAVPGGNLDKNESLEQGCKREVMEETGIKVNNVKFVGYSDDFYQADNLHYVSMYFLCEDFEGEAEIREPDKCSEFKWFSLQDLPKNLGSSLLNFSRKFEI